MRITRFAAALGLLASFGFHATPAHAVLIDRLEASVNSSLITLSDIQKFRNTVKLRAQLDPLFGGTALAQKGADASTQEIVQFLVNEKIISQQFPVTDAEVEQVINDIQSNNHIDRAGLRSALAQQGFNFEDYFEMIRASASKRNLMDRDIRTKVSISDDDVKNYFYNHYTSEAGHRTYQLKVIFVSFKSYKTPAAAKETALRALKDIRGGDAFEEVAKRVSDDPNAGSGGALGTLAEDQMSPAIREQVKKLKIGQVSDLFGGNSAGGYYILKLVDVKSDETARFEKMKEEIRNQLAAGEYQRQIELWLERQRQSSFIHLAGEPTSAGITPAQ